MSRIDSANDTGIWRKASYSVANGECVEVSSAQGRVSIRDSKNPNGPFLSYTIGEFLSFLEAAKRTTS